MPRFLKILLVSLLFLPGSLICRAQKLSINARDVSVQEAMKILNRETRYSFSLEAEVVDLTKKVSVSAKDASLDSVLSQIFAGQNVKWNVEGQTITVSRKQEIPSSKSKEHQKETLTVRGFVSDENGEPLPGAGVLEKGTLNGQVTSADGSFEIEVPSDAVLIFSFIGFVNQDQKVSGRARIDVSLHPDINLLDDVVVVGYGTQKKVNLTGSVATMGSMDLENRPIVQASTALQGSMPGVTVTTAGGAPGADGGTIRIRGIGTFGGSSASPLVLIDGVQGDINSVDASQIDKISVLKDAASSAIYGSRAANGVILITTKRGVKGKTSISYKGYVGFQTPTALPALVNAEEYMTLSREATENDGGISIYTDDYIAHYRENNFLDPDAYPITEWQSRLLNGNGLVHNHNLVLTTSTDKVRMMTSLGYLDQNGIIRNTDYSRWNLRNNMNVELRHNVHFRFDLSAIYGHRNQIPNQSGVFNFMNARDPLMLAQWSDGNYAAFTGGTLNILPMVEDGQGGNIKRDNLSLAATMSLSWEPFKWLTLEGTVSPRFVMNNVHNYTRLVTYYSDAHGTVSNASNAEYGSLTESSSQSYYGNWQFTATAGRKMGSHDLRVLLGMSYETMNEKTLSGYRRDYSYPDYDVLNAGAANEFQQAGGARYQWALLSYFGRINYNFRERYLFEANIRFDGSSRFAKGHRWGIFPSVSAAWRVTEEKWMAPVKDILTELKIRASYGQLGNQNIGSDYYPTIQTLTISSIYAGDQLYPIVGLNTLANEDISWETSEMYDIGLDLALWNKLTLTADWYRKTTYGILMELDIPQSIGLGAPYQNAGSVRNSGWELGIDYSDAAGDFNWNVGANLSDVHNRIIDMKGTTGGSGVIRNQEGYAINSLYGLICLGMIRTQEQADWMNLNCPQYNMESKPGDLVYKDIDNNGKIDDNDKTIMGSTIPRYTYGFNLGFGWKGLQLNAQFQGVGKADAYLSGYYTQPCQQGGTFRKEHLDRWTPETPDGRFPRMSYGLSNTLNTKISTFWMGNASYCRLKNLQLSYTLPDSVLSKAKIAKVSFFANATNLFTITRYYQGYDPENQYSGGSDGVTTGAFASNYPLVRSYTFGVELKF